MQSSCIYRVMVAEAPFRVKPLIGWRQRIHVSGDCCVSDAAVCGENERSYLRVLPVFVGFTSPLGPVKIAWGDWLPVGGGRF